MTIFGQCINVLNYKLYYLSFARVWYASGELAQAFRDRHSREMLILQPARTLDLYMLVFVIARILR